MDETPKAITRKNGRHLRVPVLPNEETQIKANAVQAGLSVAEYLRRISLGYPLQSVIDKEHVIQLAKINADLGRLGGLLKLWLTQDKRVAHFDHATIMTLLRNIRGLQDSMYQVVKKL
ncbi:conjugal transfer transcriptional regulator TraJ [Legionella pneumophila]|uniref:TraJ protein n=1 Tax=Legionella pneumophila subsp. pascullei TaxID=91890 RepID=A0AAX2IY66_LEGPN|nr:conjugal transfer transcriptional regulator TraJ [Legionella pneumophila]AMP93502.1 conjugal transfer protein TrbJ [Legionella pneumophila subsp. pascullei]SQG91451.1 traJ protein [Legionella pneumophila subsp. pascullei]VEH07997.1 traJ protein [Legionella pneumophila subsp. pascullei]HAU3861628.1 conjugal transfer transcriptional regulator TraJ [Legionella pneumophila]HBD7059908.1 conjugal transfer transcriptional regulator TraJ [Legionella pneumophila]